MGTPKKPGAPNQGFNIGVNLLQVAANAFLTVVKAESQLCFRMGIPESPATAAMILDQSGEVIFLIMVFISTEP
jgi:hypothetical protein